MIAIKVLAIIGVIVGIYFFIEDQLDINLNPAKMEGKEGDSSNGGYLESVTGASLDEQLIDNIVKILTNEGCDAWFSQSVEYFLTDKYKAKNYNEYSKILFIRWSM